MEEQIDVLFLYHVMRPSDEQLREYYRQEVKTGQVQETLPVELLKAQGYTDEQIERMRAAIPLAVSGERKK
ncbi:MAG: hypothetical protein C4K49_10560 [Candidatus Thorarchaeota archaeon]|nr:MAG: hypothetical protein C4K49_10560 [Candidatus Thorarchaeota archaeon]